MATKSSGEALAIEAEIMRKLGLQLGELQDMGITELRAKHIELFGEEAKSKNLPYLRKRLAYRLQERVEGGLSPAALARIEELAPAELPMKWASLPPSASLPSTRLVDLQPRDPRLPEPGTILKREHKGLVHEVEVQAKTYLYRGRAYSSLSAIAKEITGTTWNGFAFFDLKKEKTDDRN